MTEIATDAKKFLSFAKSASFVSGHAAYNNNYIIKI